MQERVLDPELVLRLLPRRQVARVLITRKLLLSGALLGVERLSAHGENISQTGLDLALPAKSPVLSPRSKPLTARSARLGAHAPSTPSSSNYRDRRCKLAHRSLSAQRVPGPPGARSKARQHRPA